MGSVNTKMVEATKNVQELGVSMDVLPRNSSDLYDEDGRPKRTGNFLFQFMFIVAKYGIPKKTKPHNYDCFETKLFFFL